MGGHVECAPGRLTFTLSSSGWFRNLWFKDLVWQHACFKENSQIQIYMTAELLGLGLINWSSMGWCEKFHECAFTVFMVHYVSLSADSRDSRQRLLAHRTKPLSYRGFSGEVFSVFSPWNVTLAIPLLPSSPTFFGHVLYKSLTSCNRGCLFSSWFTVSCQGVSFKKAKFKNIRKSFCDRYIDEVT